MFEILEISNSTEMEIGKIIVIKPTSLLYKLFSGIYLEVFIFVSNRWLLYAWAYLFISIPYPFNKIQQESL